MTGDNVLSQTESTYDKDGKVILVTDRERNHDETTTGALGNPTTAPKARVSYTASYYDPANRLTGSVDVGTNGGTAWTRPSSVPTASDTVLVTLTGYNAAGWVNSITDPRGIVEQKSYDNLGELTQTIEAYTNGSPTTTTNKTTNYTYDGDGHMLTLQAVETGGASETTKWIYGVTTTGGSDVNSNSILATVQYPDPSTGSPSSTYQESYTVNALGEQKTLTDRAGNVHTLTYDILGRVTSDAITTLATGFDGAVRRIQTAYDTQGNPYLVTSYDAATAGNIVNQVQRAYNGLGQMTQEWQAHSGAVVTGTTPSVQYAYSLMSGGANHSRLTSITYPNGKVLTYNYSTGLNDSISRLSSLSDTSGTLESYDYLGLDTIVRRAHPQPGIDLTYIKQGAEGNGDAGDQYTGLDRFGRVVDQRWIKTSTGTATDRFKYGYDRDSNALYRDNLVNSAFGELYHVNGASNGYDNLNQLSGFLRGVLSDTNSDGIPDTVASASHSQTFTPDAMGNFSSVTTDGTAVNRTHNQQNEVTGVGANTLVFDKNGNMTTDGQGRTLVYDAWNRLVAVKNGGTTLASYKIDGTGRRIVETAGTNARDLYFDGWNVLEERLNGASTADMQYVWNPLETNSLVLRDRSTAHNGTLDERLWVQQDANGDVTALINSSGSVVERYAYDPYGLVTYLNASWGSISSSGYAANYLYQGERLDPATGLLHMERRDYSPTLQRFVGVDPSGYGAGDSSLYRFVGNSPADSQDPTGQYQATRLDNGATVLRAQGAIFLLPPPPSQASQPTKSHLENVVDGFLEIPRWGEDTVSALYHVYNGDPQNFHPRSGLGSQAFAATPEEAMAIMGNAMLDTATLGVRPLEKAGEMAGNGDFSGLENAAGGFMFMAAIGDAAQIRRGGPVAAPEPALPENTSIVPEPQGSSSGNFVIESPTQPSSPGNFVIDSPTGANPQPLYHGSPLPPSTIFGGGIRPPGTNLDLDAHIAGSLDSGYVSGSISPDAAAPFAGEGGWVYEYDRPPDSVDVDEYIGGYGPYGNEGEFATPHPIDPSTISGGHPVGPGEEIIPGEFKPNPGYRGPR
ncbi:MAG: RHS repeat-associated core domain-containing protein [Gemmataceae bacterium]